jgi:hypothetical protein
LADQPFEPLWVLAPVDGVRVDRTVRVGAVEFVDAATGQEMLKRFAPPLDPRFSEPLAAASAFARIAVVARVLYDAEEEGLAIIETAAAWLTTRLRYSWSHAPDGGCSTTSERRRASRSSAATASVCSPFKDPGDGGAQRL